MAEGDGMDGSSGGVTTRTVFVSYASHDTEVANTVCRELESHGIRCWIAPRDVAPGALYADAIVRAINESNVLVIVLSKSAVGSSHVGREIERAASKHKQIIALRIDTANCSAGRSPQCRGRIDCRKDAATAGGRKTSRARSPDSPWEGERRDA
jgi:hypothetical protein